MKKILIIGAGFLQAFVIKKARELGYWVIAIDKNPQSEGFRYANEFCAVDIVDEKACLEYAKSKNIDGVMTAATDYGVLSTSFIAKELCLPGLSYEVAKIIKNKYLFRKLMIETKSDCIKQLFEVSNINDVRLIKDTIKFPVMVKPCDGSGSKGTYKVENLCDLEDACIKAISASLIGKALIEDFIIGDEYGVDLFVYNGEIHIMGIMKKKMTDPPAYAELGHQYPSNLNDENNIRLVISNAIRALGIDFGSVNMDFLIDNDGRICIVDIGARMGGNLIGSHILPIGMGIDYMGIIIKAAAGDVPDFRIVTTPQKIVTRLLALTPGKIKSLPDFKKIEEKFNVSIVHRLFIGNTINKYCNNLDGCGYIVSIDDDIVRAEHNAENAKQEIDKSIVRW